MTGKSNRTRKKEEERELHSHKERKRRNDLKEASAKDYCAARGWRVSWRDWRRYSRRSW